MINSKYNAIGIVEISFYTNAVIVLDEMLKASEVTLIRCEKLLGGRLVSIIVGGETSAVQSAIETALEMGSRVGKKNIKIAVAIPSPHPQIMKLFNKGRKNQPEQKQLKVDTPIKEDTAPEADTTPKDNTTPKVDTVQKGITTQKKGISPKTDTVPKAVKALKDSSTLKNNGTLAEDITVKHKTTQKAQVTQISANVEAQQKPNTRRKKK